MIYGSVWSREYIDSNPLPVVSKSLLPWLLKDRREAVEGAMAKVTKKDGKMETMHNGEGLDRADRDVRRLKSALEEETKSEVVEFLTAQLCGAENKAAFYRGKIYLLDKVIEATKGRVE